ncbi:copper amine oxidase N-terminal domain-containing protein [Paenibacillus agricola]|uniref:Copper amine oxidase-like protein n=1 Tax=Paenibacillus agricola TaxID=2716264 RepID=A0ABX0IXY3_9BACL|nr:stalk domain-containing protein [Paenibacillus agricola]NHN28553.1 hypothetical protein [Paenibacillus agricola]
MDFIKNIKKIGLFILVVAFMTVGLGAKEASALCIAPIFDPIPPSLTDVVINDATLTKEGTLSASVIVQEGYDQYVEVIFTGKDGKEAGRAKVDAIVNVKMVKQTVVGRDGKEYTVSMKTGIINISAKNLPLALVDFIATKDNYIVTLETRNYVPSTTKTAIQVVASDTSCGNSTLTSTTQTIALATAVFPGKVNVNQDGTITISVQMQPAYANAKIYLIVWDNNGNEVKRIAIDLKNPKISSSDLALPSGSYTIFIELTSGNDTIKSAPVTWSIPVGSTGQTPTNTVDTGNGTFPGGVEVTSSGTIRIIIQAKSNDYTTKYYLVVIDSNGKEIKRVTVNPRSPKVTLNSGSFPPSSYTLQLEMVNGSTKVRSNPVTWVIPQPTLSIPSGDTFPGTIIVNPDATYTITVTTTSINKSYVYYVVVLDANENEVKRIKFDPSKPITKTLDDLNLQTGGYNIVIEVVDPKTGGKATSKPKFITYNGTQDIIVTVDEQLQKFDQTPVNVDGRTMVPLRAIFEALGAKVEWDGATQTITATKDDTKITLAINSNEAWVNGKMVMLDVPAKLINENTMVPIRFVSEALGANVEWDNNSHSVIITNKE